MIDGRSQLPAVEGAPTLLWVNNTESDLFRMGRNGDFYFLVAGRWFKAASLDGPWTFATPTLPDDFKKIPVEHPRSRVLASVPGTPQATEAVLLASIPRTARVNKKELKAPDVSLPAASPRFKAIEGSQGRPAGGEHRQGHRQVRRPLLHVLPGRVVHVEARPTGPWEVASTIPQEIYTIPSELTGQSRHLRDRGRR